MRQIDTLGDEGTQDTQFVLDDGSVIQMSFTYRQATQRWTMDVTWNEFSVFGMNMVLHPNILREYRGVIPFGIAVNATDTNDPVDLEDFTNGRVTVYVINNDEVKAVENLIHIEPSTRVGVAYGVGGYGNSPYEGVIL